MAVRHGHNGISGCGDQLGDRCCPEQRLIDGDQKHILDVVVAECGKEAGSRPVTRIGEIRNCCVALEGLVPARYEHIEAGREQRVGHITKHRLATERDQRLVCAHSPGLAAGENDSGC